MNIIKLKSGRAVVFRDKRFDISPYRDLPNIINLILNDYYIIENYDDYLLDFSNFFYSLSEPTYEHYKGHYFAFKNIHGENTGHYSYKNHFISVNSYMHSKYLENKYRSTLFESLCKYYIEDVLKLKCNFIGYEFDSK